MANKINGKTESESRLGAHDYTELVGIHSFLCSKCKNKSKIFAVLRIFNNMPEFYILRT